MNPTIKVIISALTAFVITGGGVIVGVTGSGYALNKTSWVVAVIFGLMAAAKDIRSLLQLPPVAGDEVQGPKSKVQSPTIVPAWLLIGALALGIGFSTTGCQTQLEPGGAYAPASQRADMPLFVADSAYLLAYDTFTTVCTIEQNNRLMLWKAAPEIKKALDKARHEAALINVNWAIARKAYQSNPTPQGLTAVQTVLADMQRISATAIAVLPKQ